MIISRTPFRMSFFGGGTDYPDWYLREGGAVLSTTIDKYLYISARYLPPFFETRHRIVWSRVETVSHFDEINHPAIREGVKSLGFDENVGLDLHYQADLPARSGMGSSSAFAVGLINALMALRGQHVSKGDLALRAIDLERNILKETVGSQDQVAAAFGGLNFIEFLPNGEFRVNPIPLKRQRLQALQEHLMLFYTGISRLASEVAAEVVANMPNRAEALYQMRSMVDQAIEILDNGNPLAQFGTLLDQSWVLKRSLSSRVSNSRVDALYAQAKEAGALGGKLLGAGEAGFMLFFVPPEKQKAVRKALADLLHVPFSFSWQGSSIIHFDPEGIEHENA